MLGRRQAAQHEEPTGQKRHHCKWADKQISKSQQAQRHPRLKLRSLQLKHQRTKMTTLSKSIPTRSTRGAKATLCGGEAKTVAQPRICPTVGESSCQPLRLPEDRTITRGEAGGGQATVRSANRHHEQHNSRGRESGDGRDQKQRKMAQKTKEIRQRHGSGRHHTPPIVEISARVIRRRNASHGRTAKADNMCNPPSGHEVCDDANADTMCNPTIGPWSVQSPKREKAGSRRLDSRYRHKTDRETTNGP